MYVGQKYSLQATATSFYALLFNHASLIIRRLRLAALCVRAISSVRSNIITLTRSNSRTYNSSRFPYAFLTHFPDITFKVYQINCCQLYECILQEIENIDFEASQIL